MRRSFNKYISIAARATVQALKEEPRVKAERRMSEMTLRYQTWNAGKPSEQVCERTLAGLRWELAKKLRQLGLLQNYVKNPVEAAH